ncbi:uncharacterized protein LODBEIA_P26170 [Lodderomyces beijingensis]|uniref:Rad21/Rec8-like protein N-terminal domain-containing protein n=1 Tax=Lodderomyces beijingensis TaxID=1775926 RepID=A0ABP0ZJR4_9ASCO
MELVQASSSGLHTAWLLATLGSKASTRNKMVKKDDILKVSIPDLCQELLDKEESNIKYCSQILYGISILYKSKISYILNDINYIQLRLQNSHHFFTHFNPEQLQTTRIPKKNSRFYENDSTFHVNLDFTPLADLERIGIEFDKGEDPAAKRRKIEIAEFDRSDFPAFHGSLPPAVEGLAFALSLNEEETREVDAFMDAPIDLDNPHEQSFKEPNGENQNLNLEFDEDGHLQEIDNRELLDDPMGAGNPDFDLEVSRLDGEGEADHDPNHERSESAAEQEFYLSTNTVSEQLRAANERSTIERQNQNQNQNQNHRLRVDSESIVSRNELMKSHLNYIATMLSRRMPSQLHTVKEVYKEHNNQTTTLRPWQRSNNLQFPVLEDSISRTVEMHRRTEIMAGEASEQARNVQEAETERHRFSSDNLFGGEDAELRDPFNEGMLEMDFNSELEQELVHQPRDDLNQSSDRIRGSPSCSNFGSQGMADSLTARLNHFMEYFACKSLELNTFDAVENSYRLKFSDLAPPRAGRRESGLEPVSKRLCTNAFASVLILATNGLLTIETNPLALERNLLGPDDIKLTMQRDEE